MKDGSEHEPDETFIAELDALYYGVAGELERMRLWSLADPARRKTKRGVKRFIFLWVDKTCTRRPKPASAVPKAIPLVHAEPLEVRQEQLAKLKRALA